MATAEDIRSAGDKAGREETTELLSRLEDIYWRLRDAEGASSCSGWSDKDDALDEVVQEAVIALDVTFTNWTTPEGVS